MKAVPFSKIEQSTIGLSWSRDDIEQRLFFKGGPFTRVNVVLSLLIGILLAGIFYGALLLFQNSLLAAKFVGQGPIPYAIVVASAWCLSILVLKWSKLRLQRRCLGIVIVPDDPDFILSPRTVDRLTDNMLQSVDNPKHFLLFNRISVALSNLRNLGRVTDVEEILRSQAETDEARTETSYIILSGLIWAIPILGFIGTVLGLSVAIGQFGSVIGASGSADQILPALQKVTSGLGVAFDTTLEALVAALTIQLLSTFLKKAEQEFLDECSDYCTRNVVNRLRLLPFNSSDEATEIA